MPRSPITEQYQRLMSLVDQLHALPEDERNFVLDLFAPLAEPEQKKPAGKKAAKRSSKSSQSSTKSSRASGMAAQLKERREQREPVTTKDDNYGDGQNCIAQIDDNGGLMECGKPADDNIHHLSTHPDYHPFDVPPHVRPVPTRSPANGGAGSTTQNSEAGAASAGAATGGSSE